MIFVIIIVYLTKKNAKKNLKILECIGTIVQIFKMSKEFGKRQAK